MPGVSVLNFSIKYTNSMFKQEETEALRDGGADHSHIARWWQS